jgi:hypothetical protein
MEAFGERIVAILGACDFDIAITDEFLGHGKDRIPGGFEGLIEACGKQAGLEARGTEDCLLGQGHALDSEEFLGVNGLISCHKVGLEVGDFLEVFQADDGERGGPKTMLAGVLGGMGLAVGGAGSGGVSGVGAIGGELLVGDGFFGM